MVAYCTAAQLHEHGLPRGALPNPGRLAANVYPDSDLVELDEHGLADDAAVVLRVEDGGEMPAPLEAGATYYVVEVSDATFSLALTAGGAVIDITSEGSLLVVTTALPKSAAIAWATAVIDDYLIAHAVQLSAPFPVTVVAACAELAIAKLAASAGHSSISLGETLVRVQKQLDRWTKGVPVRGAVVPSSANLATVGVVTWESDETIP